MVPIKIRYTLGIIGFWLLESCVEPFNVSTPDAGEILVVDGVITNDPGPYIVNLSLSNPLSKDEFSSVPNAAVSIEEENGIIDGLIEEENGKYVTSANGIRGKAGNRYRLNIELQNGAEYQSEWSLLKPSPNIDSVYWRFTEVEIEGQGITDGVRLFVDTHDPEGSTEFYRYEWDETWRFSVPAAVNLEYLGNLEVKSIERKRFCWTNRKSNVINIASSSNNSSDIISEHPLTLVTRKTRELRIRYSIEVTQFALNEKEYDYLRALVESSEGSGSLFDKQPQAIIGNIVSLSNPEETALGYFSAAGMAKERIYISAHELPDIVEIR